MGPISTILPMRITAAPVGEPWIGLRLGATKVREHRQHPSVIALRWREVQFGQNAADVLCDRRV